LRCGSSAPAAATRRAPFSWSLRVSSDVVLPATTRGQMRLRCVAESEAARPLSSRSASSCPSACAWPGHQAPRLAASA
jgi:hypothetical protein